MATDELSQNTVSISTTDGSLKASATLTVYHRNGNVLFHVDRTPDGNKADLLFALPVATLKDILKNAEQL